MLLINNNVIILEHSADVQLIAFYIHLNCNTFLFNYHPLRAFFRGGQAESRDQIETALVNYMLFC